MKIPFHSRIAGIMVIVSASSIYAQSTPSTAADMPERWLYQPEYVRESPSDDAWWKQYADPTLDSLIAAAEANNFNVVAALKRIEIAKRQVAIAQSTLYPSLSASAGWTRQQTSGATTSPVTSSHVGSYFNAGVNINWEIDIFGRVAAKTKAAKAGVGVSRAEYEGVIVSLCAEVASSYFQLRTYQQQYSVALAHINSQETVLKMTQARYEAGIANALEVAQAKTVLYSTQASLPAIESSIRTMVNAIAVLVGDFPSQNFADLLQPEELKPAPPLQTLTPPMELLRRRPDIVESEMQLAHYAAQVGVAKKDFLPMLSISGSIGTSAHNIHHMFGQHSMEYSVAPTLSWTIFDGLSRKNNVAAARLQLEAATDDYNMTLLTAVEEVENAISNYNSAVERVRMLEKVVEESQRSYTLSVDLYKQGLTDFINVVNSQVTFLDNQSTLTDATGNVYAAQITLYKALGGGFNQ